MDCNTPQWTEQALQPELRFSMKLHGNPSKKGQQSLLLDSADILINILTSSSAQTAIPWLEKYDLQLCQKVTESLMFQRDVNTAKM